MAKATKPLKVYSGTEPYIFVSYARNDAQIVVPIIRRLQEHGYRVWYDRAIQKGARWGDVIKDRLKHATVFLLFMSPASHTSREVRRECTAAEFQGKEILPVFLSDRLKPDDLSEDYSVLRSLNALFLLEIRDNFGKLIDALSRDTRMSDYYRDAELLGIGSLPTLADARAGTGSLDDSTRQERLQAIVHGWKKDVADHYEIDNVFQLTSQETRATENLREIPVPKSEDGGPANLLSRPLTIRKSYVAPMRLLSGLVSSYDENWPPIVEAYSLLAGNSTGEVKELHYFVEFCWLSWGPSVETTFLLDEKKAQFMVGQVATGDEANSMALITTPEVWRAGLQGRFSDRADECVRVSGAPMRLDGLYIVNVHRDRYFSSLIHHPLFASFFHENPIALYLGEKAAARTPPTVQPVGVPHYSTAYLWLMLEQCRSGSDKPYDQLEPGLVLPFFEHANLASEGDLAFMQHCLARKALYHVIDSAKDAKGAYGGRKGFERIRYRYATALFDTAMVETLKEEIQRLSRRDRAIIEERLVIPQPKDRRTSVDVSRFVNRLLEHVRESLPQRTLKRA